jgi:hypothetical protein
MATLMERVAGLQHLSEQTDLRLAPLAIHIERSSNKRILLIKQKRPMATRLHHHVFVREHGGMILERQRSCHQRMSPMLLAIEVHM